MLPCKGETDLNVAAAKRPYKHRQCGAPPTTKGICGSYLSKKRSGGGTPPRTVGFGIFEHFAWP